MKLSDCKGVSTPIFSGAVHLSKWLLIIIIIVNIVVVFIIIMIIIKLFNHCFIPAFRHTAINFIYRVFHKT